jgi:hypothetical protein
VVGWRIEEGVQPRVTLLFEAGGPLRRGVEPRLRSHVIERALLSTTMPDPSRRNVAPPPSIRPTLWRRGFLYAVTAPLLERPGVEAFELGFSGFAAPRPSGGGPAVELFRY